jgi:hypothetical protein
MDRERGLVTIRGILVPADWDSEGNVVKVGVFTADEDEYLIEVRGTDQLLDLIQKEVEVTGVLREETGQKTIVLKKYRRVRKNSSVA